MTPTVPPNGWHTGGHDTAQLGPDEHLRKAYVAPGLMLEYMVADAIMVVVVLEIFDESHYLIDEADAQ